MRIECERRVEDETSLLWAEVDPDTWLQLAYSEAVDAHADRRGVTVELFGGHSKDDKVHWTVRVDSRDCTVAVKPERYVEEWSGVHGLEKTFDLPESLEVIMLMVSLLQDLMDRLVEEEEKRRLMGSSVAAQLVEDDELELEL